MLARALPALAPPSLLGAVFLLAVSGCGRGGAAGVVAVDRALSPVGYRATFWDDGAGLRLQSFPGGDRGPPRPRLGGMPR